MVEVDGKDFGLDPVAIVDDYFALDDFVWQSPCMMFENKYITAVVRLLLNDGLAII